MKTIIKHIYWHCCLAHSRFWLWSLALLCYSTVEVFYAQATMNDGNVAVRYPRLANELRLNEAFWLAQVPLRQVDQHLAITEEWPNQFNEIGQYATHPVGEYTQQVVIKPQWVEIQVDLSR